MTHQDRPFLGILFMLGFCMLVPIGDATAKYLGSYIPLLTLVFIRFAMQIVLLYPIIWLNGYSTRMSRRVLGLTILRTGLHIIGLGAMFAALMYLPLADAIAIAFVMPFIMLLLGKYVLGEQVGRHRLIACAVGFAGTLMVVQPSFAAVGAPALLPLLVAVVFAFFMLVTRQVARDCEPVVLQAVGGVVAMPLLGVLAAASTLTPWSLVGNLSLPGPVDLGLLVMMGVVGTVAHLFMTWSLKFAPSATLAPMQYLEIPFATLAGWVVFRDIPDGLAAMGIAVTVMAGLYVIYRERFTRMPVT